MSPQKQRIAIALICGFPVDVCKCGDSETHHTWEHTFTPMCELDEIPDYLNDLNAMHEAEQMLNGVQQAIYVQNLKDIMFMNLLEEFAFVHATAAQRAEAFLKTMGKWEETP